MTSHVIILPRHRPAIRRKKLPASELRAQERQGPAPPIVRRRLEQRSPSASSLDSVDSFEHLDLGEESPRAREEDAQIYWGPIIERSPL